jgi:hypothetical protein
MNTTMQEISTRIANQDSRLDKYDSQFADTATLLTQLVNDMKKNQSVQAATSSISRSPPARTEPPLPPPTSTSYQHPHARAQDENRPSILHQELLRKDEEWRTTDYSQRWQSRRFELPKFDGTGILDWLEDCEYYFQTSHISEYYKVQYVIPSLMGDAREWHRYFKLTSIDPS